MADLNQPVAIITGGGRGVGRAAAELLAEQGYACAIVGRTKSQVESVAGQCANALPIVADVSLPADCQRIVEETTRWRTRVDVLVNNAGIAPALPVESLTLEQWRRVIDTNLTGPFLIIRACWPIFVQQSSGVIVNISSVSTEDPLPGLSAYAASKGGLNALGRALAREGEAHHIRVHTLSLGAVETAMLRSVVDEKTLPRSATLDPADVAAVILACAQGQLAHTNGDVIRLHRRP